MKNTTGDVYGVVSKEVWLKRGPTLNLGRTIPQAEALD